MKRVAICLSGNYRSFGVVEQVYKAIPKAFPEVKFDIFLAGWDYERSCFNDSEVFTQKRFYKDILPHKGGDLQLRIASRIFYLQKKVTLLRESYEQKHNFLYDAVIWSRPDIILYPKYFKKVIELVNLPIGAKYRLSNLIVYNRDGMYVVSDGKTKHNDDPFVYDLAMLGSTKSMSKYLRTYDNYVDEDGISKLSAHKAPVYQCFDNNIAVLKMPELMAHIVREAGWSHRIPTGVYEEMSLVANFKNIDLVEVYKKGHSKLFKEYEKE